MKKRRTTRMPREPLSITGYPIPKEVDYDLLAQLDMEDEGQIRPFMDPTGNPLASPKSPAQEASPHRQLDDGVMQEIFRRQAEAKAKGPSHSKAPQLQARMGSPNTLFNKKT